MHEVNYLLQLEGFYQVDHWILRVRIEMPFYIPYGFQSFPGKSKLISKTNKETELLNNIRISLFL